MASNGCCTFFDPASEIQHERRGPRGVVDSKIVKNGRIQLAIELKKPERDTPLISSFIQAHRYAFSFNYFKNGTIVHPLGILTDGNVAIVFDGSLKRELAKAGSETIDLTNEIGYQKIYKYLEKYISGAQITSSTKRCL